MDFSDEEVIKRYLSYFTSYVYGIGSEYAKELEGVDVEAFERGDIILLHEAYNEQGVPLFEIGQEVWLVSEQTGSHSYQIGRIDIDTDGRQDAAVLAQLKQRLGGNSEVKMYPAMKRNSRSQVISPPVRCWERDCL